MCSISRSSEISKCFCTVNVPNAFYLPWFCFRMPKLMLYSSIHQMKHVIWKHMVNYQTMVWKPYPPLFLLFAEWPHLQRTCQSFGIILSQYIFLIDGLICPACNSELDTEKLIASQAFSSFVTARYDLSTNCWELEALLTRRERDDVWCGMMFKWASILSVELSINQMI